MTASKRDRVLVLGEDDGKVWVVSSLFNTHTQGFMAHLYQEGEEKNRRSFLTSGLLLESAPSALR